MTHGKDLALAGLAIAAFLLSLAIGADGAGLPGSADAARTILFEVRLPRAILGFLVGAALGLAGAVLQGYLRNPLAEPGILGISGGAALGAVIAIHTGIAGVAAAALPFAGLVGAGIATLLLVMLAGAGSSSVTLILAGVAISSLSGALTSLALNLAANPFAVSEMLYWLMGSLSDRSLVHVWIAAPAILLGIVFLLSTATALDALTLGEDAAQNLGVDPGRLRWQVVGGTALAVGAATAVTGAISFVGLVVPHVLRPWLGNEPGRLLVPSLFGGAALVLLADVGLRLISPLGELRLGVLTALVGAPFFLWLVLRLRRDLAP
ncbi:MAG: iron ABC transporter permease [Hyphomicrobium sp.]|nr:iron ABC transporter permease [Hyphomicrobium sp.]